MSISRLPIGLLALLAVGCLSGGGERDRGWDSTSLCSAGIAEVAAELAGPGAKNCGATIRKLGDDIELRPVACARQAIQHQGPVLFGKIVLGGHAGDCEVVVRDMTSRVMHLTYYYDLPGSPWFEAEWCAKVTINDSVSEYGDYYDLQGCSKDQTLVDRVEELHQKYRK